MASAPSTWRFYLGRVRDETLIDDLFPITFEYQDTLNDRGTWTGQLKAKSPTTKLVTAVGSEWTYVVYAVEDGEVRWCGVIESFTWSSGAWTVTGPSLPIAWLDKLVASTIDYSSSGLTASALGHDLLVQAAALGWNLTEIIDPNNSSTVLKGKVDGTQHGTIWSVFQQVLIPAEVGIDVRPEYTLNTNGTVTRSLRTILRAGRRILTAPVPGSPLADNALAWEHGKQLSVKSFANDGRLFANDVYSDGATASGTKVTGRSDQHASDPLRPRLQRVLNAASQQNAASSVTMAQIASAEALRVGQVLTGSLVLTDRHGRPMPDTQPSHWSVGDDVWTVVHDVDLDLEDVYRILDARVVIGSDRYASVPSITLGNPGLRRPVRHPNVFREVLAYESRLRALEQIS